MRLRPSLALALLPLLAACGGGDDPGLGGPDAGATNPDSGAAPDAGETPDAGEAPDAGTLGPGEVQTTLGVVRGVAEDDLWAFRGIPYAAPPVGALRFRPPAPHEGWAEVRDTATFGPACPQDSLQGGGYSGDEDCLTLNVWTPLATEPRPVMVWIHGGGFVAGSASQPLYDGTRLTRDGGVVLVSINYRLGALGFLATPELKAESPDDVAGNYGTLDQVAALTWVRDNIAAFGGDPGNVTIFGESAGGVSVCTLLGSPLGAGLFHRAVIESGGGCFSLALMENAPRGRSALDIGAELVTAAGCDGEADKLACMRGLGAEAVVATQATISSSGLGLPDIGPCVDGVVIPKEPYTTFNQGGGNEVPVLIGSNSDEAVGFTRGVAVPTRAALEQRITAIVGPSLAPGVLALYPEADFPDHKAAFDAAFADVAFNCPAESFARVAAGGAAPSFMYYFSHRLSGVAGANGAQHGYEIPFVFGTVDVSPAYTPTADDLALAEAMLGAWSSFARDGAPSMTPAWPAYGEGADTVMVLDVPLGTTAAFRGGRCDGLRALGLVP
ncbi:MAG: carboxylesterase family protein [Myxococcales bacterium]|nr:carboxylesterase family protein [Myxococcales bacterium]